MELPAACRVVQGTLNATQQMTSLEQEYSNPLNNKNSNNANSNEPRFRSGGLHAPI